MSTSRYYKCVTYLSVIGSVLVKSEWDRVAFDVRHWTPAPKSPLRIPIEQLVDCAEKNLRDLNKQELYRLKAHYRGHPHHWREFVAHLELTLRLNDSQPLGLHIAECHNCRHTFSVTSPSYVFKTGRDRCQVCTKNVRSYPNPVCFNLSQNSNVNRSRVLKKCGNTRSGTETEGATNPGHAYTERPRFSETRGIGTALCGIETVSGRPFERIRCLAHIFQIFDDGASAFATEHVLPCRRCPYLGTLLACLEP